MLYKPESKAITPERFRMVPNLSLPPSFHANSANLPPWNKPVAYLPSRRRGKAARLPDPFPQQATTTATRRSSGFESVWRAEPLKPYFPEKSPERTPRWKSRSFWEENIDPWRKGVMAGEFGRMRLRVTWRRLFETFWNLEIAGTSTSFFFLPLPWFFSFWRPQYVRDLVRCYSVFKMRWFVLLCPFSFCSLSEEIHVVFSCLRDYCSSSFYLSFCDGSVQLCSIFCIPYTG